MVNISVINIDNTLLKFWIPSLFCESKHDYIFIVMCLSHVPMSLASCCMYTLHALGTYFNMPIRSYTCHLHTNISNFNPWKFNSNMSLIVMTVMMYHSDFAWSKELEEKMQSVFGIRALRPMQLQTMNVSMSGKDCILIMPTGGGKSLCFQLPAVVSKGDLDNYFEKKKFIFLNGGVKLLNWEFLEKLTQYYFSYSKF